ncbi:hypothetical protein C0Z22_07365 [Halobacteriovorax sp. DA5]|nr:hypothetical protein C0Z22_07365 [Halobacteriovorax sp. DA5]
MKRRGPYKNTLKNIKPFRPANYFKKEHENKGLYITWASPVDRGGGQISVAYKIQGEKKQFRTPRHKTVWMDEFDIEYCKVIIEEWKNGNNNSLGRGNLEPSFYIAHKVEFLNWLSKTCKHSTIYGYDRSLRMYSFPFLVEKLQLLHPKQWDVKSIERWEIFMSSQDLSSSSRNRHKSALRRYLRFLKLKGEIKVVPQILNEPESRESREKILPGELPEWDDVVGWIKGLPRGRYRFIMAICAGFGVRISEACAVTRRNFLGIKSSLYIDKKNDYIKTIKDAGLGALFLYVDTAIKAPVGADIIKVLGEPDNDPKTGPYTACCTNQEMANLIIEMIKNKEHQMQMTKEQITKEIASLPRDNSIFKFDQYRSHDYRRLNITLQSMDLDLESNVEICCRTHGHSSREMFLRYFQWGLTQRRNQVEAEDEDLIAFDIKA